ncbi:early transcription factor (VETF), large subunit [Finch poxvirus]|uniref:Early transcription factor 82 kDa subunit n=2 Tax=unclassified Avipoxvirus TaxID=336487 RepID=A0AAT9URY6_9POXV|nr:early transcription factor (VETF), large subunit [Finch poxvirus]UOX39169.1 early transcription factor (VETF), large subunit [Finch poxvirus]
MYVVNPQLVILVDRDQKIVDVLYLTLYDGIDDRSSMSYFIRNHLQMSLDRVRVLNRHIILTLKISQLKGYLCNLLNIDEEIIIYSHKNNLEYSYVDNTTFNPFTMTQRKTLLKSESFLYNVYIDACNFLVIWVVKASDTNVRELGSYEEVDANVLKFESKLIEMFNDLDLNFTVESKFNNIFRTNLKMTGLRNLVLNNDDKKMLFIKSDEYFINLSGNHFVLNDEPINLSIWDDDGSLAISSDGNTITVNNVKLFTDMIPNNNVQMERIKSDITYKVSLATPITSKVKLDIETSFIFIETATNNILLSVDKKISIILAKNHISIKVKNYIPNIEKYFTFMVIFINRLFNTVKQSMDFTKIETIYWSRICQNTKDKNRKPVIVSSLESDMVKISDNFYKSPTKEVFVNNNDIMFTCDDKTGKYNNVGFLAIFYKLQKICIPCCFLKSQSHTDTFMACVHNKETDKSIISPYILNYGKVVTDSKISFLPPIFNEFFNSDMKIDLESDNKRLRGTKGYHVIRSCLHNCRHYTLRRIRSKNDIIEFVNSENVTLIANDIVYFPMKYSSIGNKIFILVQEIVHEIVVVKKEEDKDVIYLEELKVNKLKDIFPYKIKTVDIKEENGLKLTTDGFCVDGEPFTEPLSTKCSVFMDNISINNNPIAKYFNQIFKYVVTDNKDMFIKTWVINTMLKMGISKDWNSSQVKTILEKYYKL